MRWTAVALGLGLALGCGVDPYACVANGQCIGPDGRGWCEANGYCSFPDPDCDSGRRYGELVSDLARTCVPVDDGRADDGSGTTDAVPPSTSGSSASSDPVSTSDKPDDGTSDAPPSDATSDASVGEAGNDAGDEVGDPSFDAEGDGGSTSYADEAGGEVSDSSPPDSCEAQYGGLPSFLSCAESEEVCTFYVDSGGASCDDLCRPLGGACLEAIPDRSNGCEPDPEQAPLTCDDGSADQICVCSR